MPATTRSVYILLVVLLVWALSAQTTWSWFAVSRLFPSSGEPSMPFVLGAYSTDIAEVLPEYASSGLEPGDTVEAIEDRPLTGRAQLEQLSRHMHTGDALHMTVQRPGGHGLQHIRLTIQLRQGFRRALEWVLVLGLTVLFPLSCLVVGFYIAFARPRDSLAWVTLAMLLTFSHILNSGLPYAIPQPLRGMLQVYKPLVETWPVWLFYFGLLFPVPFEYVRRHKWPLVVPALPWIFIAGIEVYGNLAADEHLSQVVPLGHLLHSLDIPLTFLYTAYILAFFYFLNAKMHRLPTGDARRRLQVMIWGCTLALLPLFPVAMSEAGLLPRMPPWAAGLALLMLLLFPATMAYVIVVQKAMDVRMVVRTGVQYAIASNGLKVLRIVLISLLVWLSIYLVREAGNRHWLVALVAVTGTLFVVGLRSIMERMSRWMDRRFFREAYDAEQILTELSNSVASIRDVPVLVETVARRIAESLHVNHVTVLLDRSGMFTPVYAFGYGRAQPAVTFARSASTLRLLRQMGSGPSRIYFDDPQSWVYSTPSSEQSALQQLNAEVLLPVTQKSRMLGLITLGRKRSETPYSRVDLQLLGAVASQTGLALENAELTENIRLEVAQRERLDRELEIAREVQQRLFPQSLPKVDGLDFAGYCRPALGVGGDYYDFIHLTDGCLGLAIGDVSGKGIAAALMMASLQASLRAQTIKPCASLSEMIQLVNRLVFEASSSNRYATFFYAQFDPQTRLLHYVNAGHNAPVLYRPNGKGEPQVPGEADTLHPQFFRLDVGGTVLGLFGDLHFQEGSFKMQRGDVMVAFTDGICEAMNADDEEFGEDRLLDTLRQGGRRSAAEVASCLIEEVDGFVRGAPQHDDMTLLVMRIV